MTQRVVVWAIIALLVGLMASAVGSIPSKPAPTPNRVSVEQTVRALPTPVPDEALLHRAAQRASRTREVLSPKASMSPKAVHPPRKTVTVRSRKLLATSTLGTSDITAYCGGGITASGKPVYQGEVATLSRSIPFGTQVRIEGVGVFTVEDRIGHGSQFDVYMDSCSAASAFGRKHRQVVVLH